MERESRWAHVRVQGATGAQVPQRRSRHDRGRQVQLRAIQGRRRHDVAGTCPAGGDHRPIDDSLSPQRALAGLPDVLRNDGDRRRDRRAQEICHAGRRRWLQEASDRRRTVQARESRARRRDRARGLPGLLATRPSYQAAHDEKRSRRHHAHHDGEDRRGRHWRCARR